MSEDTKTDFQVNYAYSKGATEEHKAACTEALSVILGYAQTDKLAVVDCYSRAAVNEDNTLVEGADHGTTTIIAALIDVEEGQAILPLAQFFNGDSSPNDNLVPCVKVETDVKEAATQSPSEAA